MPCSDALASVRQGATIGSMIGLCMRVIEPETIGDTEFWFMPMYVAVGDPCEFCGGEGTVPDATVKPAVDVRCPACGGTGVDSGHAEEESPSSGRFAGRQEDEGAGQEAEQGIAG